MNLAAANVISPLIAAIGEGRTNVVGLLLSHHADPNLAEGKSLMPLVSAVARKSFEMVRPLLAGGSNPTAVDRHERPHCGLQNFRGRFDIAGLLRKPTPHR